jgi:hypothetical protein
LIKELLIQFESRSSVKYSLDGQTSLILLKDERRLNNLRRYEDSPFPLISNVEYFCTSSGDWNKELLEYGIKTRSKLNDLDSPSAVGSRIHLIRYDTVQSRGNRYLKRQYRRLAFFRDCGRNEEY